MKAKTWALTTFQHQVLQLQSDTVYFTDQKKQLMMSLLRKISDLGISYAENKSEKRSVILTNYISLVASVATFFVVGWEIFFRLYRWFNIIALLEGCLFFLIPIIFKFSRIY